MTQLVCEELAVEVSMRKLNPTELFPKPKPYKKVAVAEASAEAIRFSDTEAIVPLRRQRTYIDRATGETLGTTEKVTYKDDYVDDKGVSVSMEQILWLIEQDGKYQQVRPYSRTTIMTGMVPISRTAVENWIPESAYEIYVNHSKYKKEYERKQWEGKLFQKAEEWYNADKAMIGKWVFREGSQPYVMVLFPYIKKLDNGVFQFCFVAYFSRTKNEYQNLMEIAPISATVQIVEEPNTAQLLAAIAK